jgi:hypothetical protein
MNLSEAVSEYCTSQHFTMLGDGLKANAEQLLAQWAYSVDDDLDFDTLESSVKAVGNLDLPLRAKRDFPELLGEFFAYLGSTGSFPDAASWSDALNEIGPAYSESIREDGSIKGKTVTRALKIGRNDPCPCGSGKKYKKCCG